MSQKRQSSQEQIFAESAAKFLGENWTFFEPRPEAPDFIVDDGRVQFGLEITQIFKGDILPNGGSSILRAEGERQKLIDKTRISYEKKCAARLSLRILGKIDQATLEQIEQELISAQFDCLEIGTRRELNFNN